MILDSMGRKKKRKIILFGLLAAAFAMAGFFWLTSQSGSAARTPSITNGTLNLASWDFDKDGLISLNGNWDFYWNRLLSYQNLKIDTQTPAAGKVPGVWNRYDVSGGHPSGSGMATYRLHVVNAVPDQKLAINVQSVSTAYRLYVDDTLVLSTGRLSTDGGYYPEYGYKSAEFTVPGAQFDILVQVENHVYAKGGIWQAIRLGTPVSMTRLATFHTQRDFFTLGCLFMAGVALLIVIVFMKGHRNAAYLLAATVLMSVRVTFHGSYAVYTFFPDVPFGTIIRADYLTIILAPLFVTCFIQSLTGKKMGKAAWFSVLFFYLGAGIFTLLAPLNILTGCVFAYEAVLLLLSLYCAFLMAESWNSQTEVRVVTVGVVTLLIFSIHDALYQASVIDSLIGDIFPFGYTVMMFCLILFILKKYNDYMKTNLLFLRAQIRPHFIHNALNTILIISRRDPERSRELLMDFSSYLRSSYDRENVDELIPLDNELDHVRAYAAIEQARFGDKLSVDYQIGVSQIRIPPLTLQPLVENAIVHGIREKEDGGEVTVYTERRGKAVRIGVRDNGVGFQSKKAEHMGGSGIGLDNIDKRLKKICRSRLVIETSENEGSNVYFELKG